MAIESDQFLTVVFVDICNSTRLFEEVGNARALAMTSECIEALKSIITQERGTVIQTQGDGIFCSFPTPDAAFSSVCLMAERQKNNPLAIHAGLHYGPVIVKDASVFGDTVNVASRMAGLAKDEEIILSKDAWDHLSPLFQNKTRPLGEIPVKGKADPVAIYQLMLSEDGTTAWTKRFEMSATSCLELRYQKQLIEITDSAPDFVIGRLPECDLTVNHSHASRRHATIECQRGKFFLADHSSNGTYIGTGKKKLTLLQRDFMQLFDEGTISLGSKPEQHHEHLIHFKVNDSAADV